MRIVINGRVLVGASLGALLSAAPASLQPTQANARTVLAAVVNGQGRPIVDVGLDDFVVTEGGEPREVLDVHVADYPVAVLLDDRPEVAPSLSTIRAAARHFIERVGDRPVALFPLTSPGAPVTTLDDDRVTALERLDAIESRTGDVESPLDTVARASTLLKDSGASFSAVVIIAAAPVDATALVRGERLPQILESGAAVHVVQVQPAGLAASADAAGPDLLRVIADQTRGQFTAIFSSASFDAALNRLADRIAIEMMIQYLVPPGPKLGDVQVGVRVPGARVIGLGVR